MLKQRVITALFLLAIFLGCLFLLPPLAFQLFVAIVFGIAAWEWADLSGFKTPVARAAYAISLLAGLLAGWWLMVEHGGLQTFFLIAATWWALALLWVQGYPSSAVFWQSPAVRAVMGVLVIVPAGIAVLILHGLEQGRWLILALLVLVATADTGAYFSGKAFGKRKLAPKVSPGKSWEGVIGGLVLVTAIALAYGFLQAEHWYAGLVIALPAAAVSVLGDLVESMVKRHRGVKDSGRILPGHGGVMDRIDGITAAAPVFALALLASGWSL